MVLRIEPARKAGELARKSDDAMARHDDRYRVSAVCRADCACGLWVAELIRKLAVGACLPEGNAEQCLPHLLLEVRSPHIERHRKGFSLVGEVFVQLLFGAKQHRMCRILDKIGKTYTPSTIILP